ncbi:toprim domain-containing protein [Paraflavisolibacter sp. H34]|uniref:toprim domain-containing protein n=1 Tax=Huijunlia imazamoxiresistens TaxID=3127457 RepID=UPI003017F9DE
MSLPTFSCRQARELDLVDYLASLGYQPQKITHSDYWYCSPLREEKTASFKVDRQKNLWYDHGIGKGGNLIDFGVLYHKCPVSELLQKLSGNRNLSFSFHPPVKTLEGTEAGMEKIRVVEIGELRSIHLLQYLERRKIPREIAARYCHEVVFELYGKRHIAIGFPNNAGGYELRNNYFKGCSAPKDTSFIGLGASRLTVFEGFFNFLSYHVLYPMEAQGLTNFLVLNSLSFLDRSRSQMEKHSANHLCLDRDPAGVKATQQALGYGLSYTDQSHRYGKFKDLNEFLLDQGQSPKKSLRQGRCL